MVEGVLHAATISVVGVDEATGFIYSKIIKHKFSLTMFYFTFDNLSNNFILLIQ